MPTLKLEFEVYCSCGRGLCGNTTEDRKRNSIIVEPCDSCLEEKYIDGNADGYARCEKDMED